MDKIICLIFGIIIGLLLTLLIPQPAKSQILTDDSYEWMQSGQFCSGYFDAVEYALDDGEFQGKAETLQEYMSTINTEVNMPEREIDAYYLSGYKYLVELAEAYNLMEIDSMSQVCLLLSEELKENARIIRNNSI